MSLGISTWRLICHFHQRYYLVIKYCFFCGEEISERTHNEHVFPNAFLRKWNLKEKTFTLFSGDTCLYSRLKVDSHQNCNNESGSRYEEKVLEILNELDSNQASFENQFYLEKPSTSNLICKPSDDIRALLSTWFIKLFYGPIWFEARLRNYNNREIQSELFNMLKNESFKLLQKSYKIRKGFNLPSSIYYLRLNSTPESSFDYGSTFDPLIFWIRLQNDFFMIAIGDGELARNYISLDKIKEDCEKDRENPLFFLKPLSYFIAVRTHIPRSPSFVINHEGWIMNMSQMTGSTKTFGIDCETVKEDSYKILLDLKG